MSAEYLTKKYIKDILKHKKNNCNEVFFDDWVMPITWESVSTNEVKWWQFSKVDWCNQIKDISISSAGTVARIEPSFPRTLERLAFYGCDASNHR